jgi:hypothetical protein
MDCFIDPEHGPSSSTLEKVTFEPGSTLQAIEQYAFSGCDRLKSICLPASLQSIDGTTFADCSLSEITIESSNPFLQTKGPFILDSKGTHIVRYFGRGVEVSIPDEIETLGSGSFTCCDRLVTIEIGPMSKLLSIGKSAFQSCSHVQAITIPASVKKLGVSCFSECRALQAVSFCADSQLDSITKEAFACCGSLQSIALPSSVKVLGKTCFVNCSRLGAVVFAADSKLVRIKDQAFQNCSSLQSLCIPPLVEFVGKCCFLGCSSLSSLAFSSPCHIRDLLDLPLGWLGLREIPDSVENLGFQQSPLHQSLYTLSFGAASRLRQVTARPVRPGGRCQCLLLVPTTSLKIFRSNLEFQTENVIRFGGSFTLADLLLAARGPVA